MEPTKKLWKVKNISFNGWILCIIELYPTTTSITKAKPNTPEICFVLKRYYIFDK